MAILEDYWRGVLLRLQGEVDVFSKLVSHAGEQGRANELALANVLRPLVPERFGIASGLVIDSEDRGSRQVDLVVFERGNEPVALAQATHLLHPVESVLTAIEVKTRLQSDDIDDCLQKGQSLLSLRPTRSKRDGTDSPDFVLLAYASSVAPETMKERFGESEGRPALACVLNRALIGGHVVVGAPNEPLPVGHVLLREDGADVQSTAAAGEMLEIRGGHTYPVVTHGGTRYLGDPARALLLFVEALVRRLAEQQGLDSPAMSEYLTEDARHISWI